MPSLPTPTLDGDLLELGPADVYWNNLFLGYMGEQLAVKVKADAVPLTGGQRGNVPINKVVSGGHFQIVVPFKEISAEHYAIAMPNAKLTTGVASGARLEWRIKVGQKLRDLAKQMDIIKLIGETESTDPMDHTVIPLCSPVDTEVVIPYHPTQQREILGTFEAWPDSTGLWAYAGAAAA